MTNNFNNVKNILNSFGKAPIFEVNPGSIQQFLEQYSMGKKIEEANAIKNMVNNRLNPIINNGSILQNQMLNNMQNKIEEATARGLLGGDTAQNIINKDLVKPIDDVLTKAKADLLKPNRGIMLEGSPLKYGGPTASSIQKKLPAIINDVTTPGGYQQMLIDTSPKVSLRTDIIDDVAEKLAKSITGVKSTGTKTIIKKLGPTVARASGKGLPLINAIKPIASKLGPWGIGASIVIPAAMGVYDWFKERENNTKKQDGQVDGGKSTNNSNVTSGASTRAQAQALARQLSVQPTVQPAEQVSEQVGEQVNPQYINEYIQQLRDINQPYINALQDYYKNYDKYLNDYHRARNFYTGLAGWTGNQQWADVGKDYNAVINEANRLSTLKTLQDAQAGNINAINEIMGNLAVADDMGISPEAAFANKNLLTALMQNKRISSDLDRAQLMDAYRRYAVDQRVANALAVQGLRNRGMLDVANINAQAYGYGGQYQPAPGLTTQGQAQPVNNNAADLYKNIIGR